MIARSTLSWLFLLLLLLLLLLDLVTDCLSFGRVAAAGTGGCKGSSTVTFDTTQTRRHSSPASSARRRNSLAALTPVRDSQYTVRSSADIKNWRDLRENSATGNFTGGRCAPDKL